MSLGPRRLSGSTLTIRELASSPSGGKVEEQVSKSPRSSLWSEFIGPSASDAARLKIGAARAVERMPHFAPTLTFQSSSVERFPGSVARLLGEVNDSDGPTRLWRQPVPRSPDPLCAPPCARACLRADEGNDSQSSRYSGYWYWWVGERSGEAREAR